jgi:hypothetical protein
MTGCFASGTSHFPECLLNVQPATPSLLTATTHLNGLRRSLFRISASCGNIYPWPALKLSCSKV